MVFHYRDGFVENDIGPNMIKLIVSISVKESADCDYNCKPDGSCRVTYTGHLGRISRQGYTEVKTCLTIIFG